MTRRLASLAALPLAGIAVGALLGLAGPGNLAATLRGASPGWLLAAILAYALFFVARAVRWSFLLRSAGLPGPVASLAALGSVAWMVSTFVPFKAGDAVRAVLLARRKGAPLAGIAGTIAMERALDLAGVAVAASLGLAFVTATGLDVPPEFAPVVAIAWALPLAGLAFAASAAVALRGRTLRGPLRYVGQGLDGLLAILRDPRRALPAAGLTLLVKVAQVGVYAALLHAFLPQMPWVALALVPLFLLSFLLSVTPAHVGTYEAAFVLVFALAGLPAAALAAAAFAVHLSAIAIVTLLGLVSLTALGRWPGVPAPDPTIPSPTPEPA